MQNLLGVTLPGPYKHVMYVLQKCYLECGWAAYAYVGGWNSVYVGAYYKQVGVTVHELGHNFGMVRKLPLFMLHIVHICMLRSKQSNLMYVFMFAALSNHIYLRIKSYTQVDWMD